MLLKLCVCSLTKLAISVCCPRECRSVSRRFCLNYIHVKMINPYAHMGDELKLARFSLRIYAISVHHLYEPTDLMPFTDERSKNQQIWIYWNPGKLVVSHKRVVVARSHWICGHDLHLNNSVPVDYRKVWQKEIGRGSSWTETKHGFASLPQQLY